MLFLLLNAVIGDIDVSFGVVVISTFGHKGIGETWIMIPLSLFTLSWSETTHFH